VGQPVGKGRRRREEPHRRLRRPDAAHRRQLAGARGGAHLDLQHLALHGPPVRGIVHQALKPLAQVDEGRGEGRLDLAHPRRDPRPRLKARVVFVADQDQVLGPPV